MAASPTERKAPYLETNQVVIIVTVVTMVFFSWFIYTQLNIAWAEDEKELLIIQECVDRGGQWVKDRCFTPTE